MAEWKNDGGPAFPVPGLEQYEQFNGMALRDYFAAKALEGLLASWDQRGINEFSEVASDAYKLADAMLKARVMPLPEPLEGETP